MALYVLPSAISMTQQITKCTSIYIYMEFQATIQYLIVSAGENLLEYSLGGVV